MTMARPKILLTNCHPDPMGGHCTYFQTVLRSSLSDSYDLAVASSATSAVYQWARQNDVTCFGLEFPLNLKKPAQLLQGLRDLTKLYREFPFRILHCNGWKDQKIAICWKALCQRKVALVRTHHAVKKIPADYCHHLVNNRLTDRNIYVSRTMQGLCEEANALKLVNTVVIPNGVDLRSFSPRPKDQEVSDRLGISPDEFVFGSVAGLSPYKRVDLIISATAQIDHAKKFRIVVLGQEGFAHRILDLAKRLGVEDRLIYAGMQEDVRPFISVFDAGFVLSDAVETISFSAREMMAMGVPLISSSFSGLVENVDHGKEGLLITPGDLIGLKEAMIRFLDMDTRTLQSFRDAARRKAEAEFSVEGQIRRMHDCYQLCLAAYPAVQVV
jgi:glycosyltransferase involved in cell wall biosynthesis